MGEGKNTGGKYLSMDSCRTGLNLGLRLNIQLNAGEGEGQPPSCLMK